MKSLYGIVYIAGIVGYVTCVCPDGWMRHGSTCYHFSHDTEDWPGALTMCSVIGGTLVEIDGQEKNSFLTSQTSVRKNSYWFALSDVVEEGHWVWMVSKTRLQSGSYSNWSPMQPTNSKNNQNCGVIKATGMWNDVECDVPHHYICEKSDETTDIVG